MNSDSEVSGQLRGDQLLQGQDLRLSRYLYGYRQIKRTRIHLAAARQKIEFHFRFPIRHSHTGARVLPEAIQTQLLARYRNVRNDDVHIHGEPGIPVFLDGEASADQVWDI